MKTLKILALSAAMLFTGQGMATSIKAKAPGEWEKLGTKIVNMRADHDVLMVTHQDVAIPCPVNNMAALNANIFIVFIILVFFCLLF